MCRMLVSVCLVLVLASVSFADYLAQSWEDGGGDISSWGPSIVGGQTVGVTDGSLSCAVVCSVGWGFIGQVAGPADAYGNTINAAAWQANTDLKLDVTTLASQWDSQSGFQFGLVINSDQTGWQQVDIGNWWNGGLGDRTETLDWNYSALKTAITPGWVQVILYQNSYSNDGSVSNAIYYLDNLRVTGAPVPEPATMALLGLGGLALIRRKK